MVCEECSTCPILVFCDEVDRIIDEQKYLKGEHDLLMAIYAKGRSDGEAEYTYKVMDRIIEVDADYISIDHLIEVLEDAKENNG